MADLLRDYSIEVDSVAPTNWNDLLHEFDDANIHQTWSEGEISYGERNLSHLVLRRAGEVVGMAQVSLRILPLRRAGIATLYWGPLWRRKGMPEDTFALNALINSLQREYVKKRGFLLRIWPSGIAHNETSVRSTLEATGFRCNPMAPAYRTLIADLSPSLPDIRRALDQKWRNMLNSAEKNGLAVIEGTSDDMYPIFPTLLAKITSPKNFTSGVDYHRYRRIQQALPDDLKMKIFVCTADGEPIAATVLSAIGDTGIYLLGATGNKGLQAKGSYLLHWAAIKWLKEQRGCRFYDLGGIDPSGNPGVYHFKRGLAHKTGKEVTHIGQYYLATSPASYLIGFCIDRLRPVKTLLQKVTLFHH